MATNQKSHVEKCNAGEPSKYHLPISVEKVIDVTPVLFTHSPKSLFEWPDWLPDFFQNNFLPLFPNLLLLFVLCEFLWGLSQGFAAATHLSLWSVGQLVQGASVLRYSYGSFPFLFTFWSLLETLILLNGFVVLGLPLPCFLLVDTVSLIFLIW